MRIPSITYPALFIGLVGLALGCSAPTPSECADGFDNDGDGRLDADDPNCAEEGTEFGPVSDTDRDGISDLDEGIIVLADTDGDGTPDFDDIDSDDDGLTDRDEAGDFDANTTPIDSDEDGVPNFRDLDSDNNGLPDSNVGTESMSDLDFDGIPNYADLDDDNDGLPDSFEIESAAMPTNTDGDLVADFQDVDSDDDTIMDLHEQLQDNDSDGIPAFRDLDSDNDCIPDAMEAGDDDLSTGPIDSDGDSLANYVDIDSDGDFLLDELEDLNCNGVLDPGESSPLLGDTDGDGVSDVLEYASGTDANDPTDNPQANGDFVFEIPFMLPTNPPVDSLEFTTTIKYVDLYFSFDTTGSMSQELAAMASSTAGVPAIIDTLQCHPTGGTCVFDTDCSTGVCFDQTCIEDPAITGCLPNMWTGVGRFDEIDSFTNLLAPQSDPALTAANIPTTGGGGAEAPLQAPACVADGSYCLNQPGCVTGADTCVGFRDIAVRILMQITDADNQCLGTRCSLFDAHTAGQALIAKQIKFVGLYGTDDNGGADPRTPEDVAREIAIAANSVGFWGQPFVYLAVDSAVVTQAVNAVREIFNGIDVDVTITATDLPNDDGDALQFIDYLEVNTSGVGNCTAVPVTVDDDGDGFHDAFPSLEAGTPVCWDVHPVESNTVVNPTGEPAIFRARLTVYGDGSELDSRTILFFVPPNFIVD